ncbi:hypothetical protein [Xenorhabdus bovienii]|uniref:hypothetical protein n=1 Tax=Xenorhabdus bovienii TaxID=40576 RepID=UPI002157AE4A|nr:hypothetical protein [Xenorhabdus bovienii]
MKNTNNLGERKVIQVEQRLNEFTHGMNKYSPAKIFMLIFGVIMGIVLLVGISGIVMLRSINTVSTGDPVMLPPSSSSFETSIPADYANYLSPDSVKVNISFVCDHANTGKLLIKYRQSIEIIEAVWVDGNLVDCDNNGNYSLKGKPISETKIYRNIVSSFISSSMKSKKGGGIPVFDIPGVERGLLDK